MYYCKETVKSIKDAYTFVCYHAWYDVGESVSDVFNVFIEHGYTTNQFVHTLLKAGVITVSAATDFINKFSGEELDLCENFVPSEHLKFFIDGVDEEDAEKYIAMLYAAMLLCDENFRDEFWDNYEDDIDEDDEYALEERGELIGEIIYGMLQIPICK